ncbi:MAG: hypothetical protein JRJ15_03105 [Deltaproteobacteria bacterium]|nr:hypothetical protein [Deltaproteobacteria bacterium]
MAKTLKDPKDIFKEIIADYQGIYGNDLIGIILYGSAAGEDYQPGKSDINFMIILSEEGIEHLDRAFTVVKKWRKKDVAIPLFLTESYLETSLDVFPIEYLNFQRSYVHVSGKDILKDLRFDPEFIRLQCEREIKGKLLLLREAFLETSGKTRALKEVIRHSAPALVAIFRALLFLKGEEVPKEKREVVRNTCEVFGMDAAVFKRLLDIKDKKIKPADKEMAGLFKEYLSEVRKLAKLIDAMGG